RWVPRAAALARRRDVHPRHARHLLRVAARHRLVLHLYSGQDEFRLREAFLELRASLDTDGMLETNTAVLAPRGLTPGLLVQHVTTVPFLAGARLVVVEGLV